LVKRPLWRVDAQSPGQLRRQSGHNSHRVGFTLTTVLVEDVLEQPGRAGVNRRAQVRERHGADQQRVWRRVSSRRHGGLRVVHRPYHLT